MVATPSKKVTKKVTTKSESKKRSRKVQHSWSRYIFRTLKQIQKDQGLSGKGMKVMQSFVQDLFERLACEAATLTRISSSKTMTSREIQTAVRLLLPSELAKHAVSEGTKAVAKFSSHRA